MNTIDSALNIYFRHFVQNYTSEDLKPHPPVGGAMVQTVTGNLVEVSSAVRIEIFTV